MNNAIFKNFLTLDYKSINEIKSHNGTPNSSGTTCPIEQILLRYLQNIGDYENNELTEAVFIRLGWSNRYKDTISNFYFTYLSSLDIFSKKPKTDEYRCNLKDYKLYYYKDSDINKENNSYILKTTIAEKSLSSNYFLHDILNIIRKEKSMFSSLSELSQLNDSISNFMPHPGYPFNQVKGCSNTGDSLNLMIDKIQSCIDSKSPLEYKSNDKTYKVDLTTITEWQNWFIKNQEKYCLDEFYKVVDGKIKGSTLFKNQSIEEPYPKSECELNEYMKNIILKLKNRAKLMSESLH